MSKSITGQFLAFCRSKPADEEYNYSNPCGCAYFQFLSSAGYPVRFVYAHHWVDTNFRNHWLAGENELGTPLGKAIQTVPWTFGALADRLAALQSVKEG